MTTHENKLELGRILFEVFEAKDPTTDVIWDDLPPMEQELYGYCAWWVIIQADKMGICTIIENENP